MNTDPIADYLTRIRNGIMAGHDAVVVPASKIKAGLCGILKQEGHIHSFKQVEHEGRTFLIVNLKYVKDKQNVIHGLRRVSRPGLRIYRGRDAIPTVMNGLGVAIVTTPKGVMTDRKARATGVGGEVLCYVA